MNIHQEQILDNYKNPQNTGEPDWVATHSGKAQNLSCGDSINIKLLIEDGVIKDLRFMGEGCSIAIASASLLTEELKGQKVEDVKKMNIDEILEMVGIELTPSRQKCAMLALDAVRQAVS